MARVICTRTVTIRYPGGHQNAGLEVATYVPGDHIKQKHLDMISEHLRNKCTSLGDTPEEVEEVVDDEEDPVEETDGLEELKVADLRGIAVNENVEISGSTNKSNLIDAIRISREA